MKAQEYNLTGNEKFSVWYTTMMMMTSAQLDPDSKARIMNMAKIMCVGELSLIHISEPTRRS